MRHSYTFFIITFMAFEASANFSAIHNMAPNCRSNSVCYELAAEFCGVRHHRRDTSGSVFWVDHTFLNNSDSLGSTEYKEACVQKFEHEKYWDANYFGFFARGCKNHYGYTDDVYRRLPEGDLPLGPCQSLYSKIVTTEAYRAIIENAGCFDTTVELETRRCVYSVVEELAEIYPTWQTMEDREFNGWTTSVEPRNPAVFNSFHVQDQ